MSQNFLHKDREAIQTPMVRVRKRLQHYVTNLIDAILSVISDFIIEQRISAIDFNPLFSSLGKLYFPRHIYHKVFRNKTL